MLYLYLYLLASVGWLSGVESSRVPTHTQYMGRVTSRDSSLCSVTLVRTSQVWWYMYAAETSSLTHPRSFTRE